MTKQGATQGSAIRIGTPVDRGFYDALKAIADREDRSIASVIRRALEREIEREAA